MSFDWEILVEFITVHLCQMAVRNPTSTVTSVDSPISTAHDNHTEIEVANANLKFFTIGSAEKLKDKKMSCVDYESLSVTSVAEVLDYCYWLTCASIGCMHSFDSETVLTILF